MPRFVDNSASSKLILVLCFCMLVSAVYIMYHPGNPYSVPMAPGHVFPFGGRYAITAEFYPPRGTVWRDSSNLMVLFICLTICCYLRFR
ncbi:p10 [Pistachio virus X]|uniref:p10 n=1 Tax=Pistachio virus X TaxID=2794236 RepID=A0A7T0M826_9VIRU|nr:p10 [Pistachio virus X]